MKLRTKMAIFAALLMLLQVAAVQIACAAAGKTLVVNNGSGPCPGATFTRIQDAIDAASSGDEILICSGIYSEQLSINKSLDIDAKTGASLVPGTIKQNATSLATGDGIAAAVFVTGATSVSISGLTVDGINNGIFECAPKLIGVYFQNSSGSLRHAAIRNFKLSTDLNGCQSGTGVFVESGGGQTSDVEIADSSIHDFQKNGITANESGTNARIHNNVVTGIGPTTGAAQNGIQIGFSATGAITENTVANTIWSPCTDATTCQAVATGILVTQSDGVHVSGNTVGVTQVAIFVDGNDARVRGNTAYASSVFENIRAEGDGNHLEDNRVANGGEADIFISGNNDVVRRNSVTEAPVGILKAQGSTGTIFGSNTFFNVAVTIQDPAANPPSKRVLADR